MKQLFKPSLLLVFFLTGILALAQDVSTSYENDFSSEVGLFSMTGDDTQSTFEFTLEEGALKVYYNKVSWHFFKNWVKPFDFKSNPYLQFKVKAEQDMNLKVTIKDIDDNKIAKTISLSAGADWTEIDWDLTSEADVFTTNLQEVQFDVGYVPDGQPAIEGTLYLDDYKIGEAAKSDSEPGNGDDDPVDGDQMTKTIFNFDDVNDENIFGWDNSPTTIENIYKEGVNTSDSIGEWVKAAGTWKGLGINLSYKMDFTQTNTFRFKLYSPEPVRILFQLFNEAEGDASKTEMWGESTKSNEWEIISWDVSDLESGYYDRFLIMIDPENDAERTFYLDDFELTGEKQEEEKMTGFSEDFESEVDMDIWAPSGATHDDGTPVFDVTQEEGALKIDMKQVNFFDGQMYGFNADFDLSENPIASLKIKVEPGVLYAGEEVDELQVALSPFSVNEADENVRQHSAVSYLVPADGEWHYYEFDWSTPDEGGDEDYPNIYTDISLILLETVTWPDTYEATFWIDDFKLGDKVEKQELSSDAEILSTSVGELNDMSIINIPAETSVTALLEGLSISEKATVDMLIESGGDSVADQDNTIVDASYVAAVTAEDGTVNEYSLQIEEQLSSEAEILSTSIGELDGMSIINIPAETSVTSLLDGLTISDLATADVLTGSDGDPVANQDNTTVEESFVIAVTAEDGTVNDYSLNVETTGIPDNQKEFYLYPNPARDFISFRNAADITTIRISNLLGQEVKTIQNPYSDSFTLNIENLNNGIYIIQAKNLNKESILKKIIIK